MKFYHAMASRIQKIWRGYYSRKVLFDYRKRKAYILEVKKKSAEMRSYLQAHELAQRQQQSLQKAQSISQKVEQTAGRMHHLLSTKHIPGVFFDARLTTESRSQLREKVPENQGVEDGYGETDGKETFTVLKLPEATLREARELKNYIERSVGHNPNKIGIRKREEKVSSEELEKKVQGPFMPRYQLQRVIQQPFKPTLRVGTDFYDTQRAKQTEHRHEILKQLSDEYFRTLGAPERLPSGPCLRRMGAFGSIPYGTKAFRETDANFNVSQKMFRTIVPPIPLFDEAEGY